MMFPLIRCNYSNALENPNVFFILSKGENAGKPGLKPWVNSFAVICPHKEYFSFYFWLVYALYQSGKFKMQLRGTAIPFINVNDVRNLIREVGPAVFDDWAKLNKLINQLDNLSRLKTNLVQQVANTENLQSCLLNQFFNQPH